MQYLVKEKASAIKKLKEGILDIKKVGSGGVRKKRRLINKISLIY